MLGDATSYRVIGSIQTVLVATEHSQAVIDAITLPQKQLVTTAIAEKGYYLAAALIARAEFVLHQPLISRYRLKWQKGLA